MNNILPLNSGQSYMVPQNYISIPTEVPQKQCILPPPYMNPSFQQPKQALMLPIDLDKFLKDMKNNSNLSILTAPYLRVQTYHLPEKIQKASFSPLIPRERIQVSYSLQDTVIDVKLLKLYPSDIWSSQTLTIQQLVEQFFRKRSSKKMPFQYKLYNALQITAQYPELVSILGIQWITFNIFKIYRVKFAQLLGVGSINGALFNKQGSLPTHGFIQINPQTLAGLPGIEDVDNDSVRLFKHNTNYFHLNSTELELQRCRWQDPRV